MYEKLAEAYLFDDSVREFLRRSNPWAERTMIERLLEARSGACGKSPSWKHSPGCAASTATMTPGWKGDDAVRTVC